MKLLKIGEVAKQTGIGIETIRYYERKGLLEQLDRRPSGYRQYDDTVIARLRFIRRSKALGFTLAETNHKNEIAVQNQDRRSGPHGDASRQRDFGT